MQNQIDKHNLILLLPPLNLIGYPFCKFGFGAKRTVPPSLLKELLTEFFRGKKQEIPAHLDSVPLQKQYLYADNAMLFATIREAISRGKLYDGNYDDDSNGVNQPPCPMVLVIG